MKPINSNNSTFIKHLINIRDREESDTYSGFIFECLELTDHYKRQLPFTITMKTFTVSLVPSLSEKEIKVHINKFVSIYLGSYKNLKPSGPLKFNVEVEEINQLGSFKTKEEGESYCYENGLLDKGVIQEVGWERPY